MSSQSSSIMSISRPSTLSLSSSSSCKQILFASFSSSTCALLFLASFFPPALPFFYQWSPALLSDGVLASGIALSQEYVVGGEVHDLASKSGMNDSWLEGDRCARWETTFSIHRSGVSWSRFWLWLSITFDWLGLFT